MFKQGWLRWTKKADTTIKDDDITYTSSSCMLDTSANGLFKFCLFKVWPCCASSSEPPSVRV